MDKIIREHQTNNNFKCCVFFGNNSTLIRKLIAQSFNNVEEIEYKDEKYAMQMSNFIWR